jgi:Xaa-Pro aminopeptidase
LYSSTDTLNTVNSKSYEKFGNNSEDTESYNVPLPVKEPSPKDPKKQGYGWGRAREKESEAEKHSAQSMTRKDSSGSSSSDSPTGRTPPPGSSDRPNVSRQSSSRSNGPRFAARPGIHGNDSSSTLVGSAYERKINDVESVKERVDTAPRLEDLRKHMSKDNLDY